LVFFAVVAAVVLVGGLFLGRGLWESMRPVPDFESLADDPDPSLVGTVAFLSADADECVSVIAASGGAAKQVGCVDGFEFGGALSWLPDGRVQFTRYSRPNAEGQDEAVSAIIDVQTGSVEQVPAADVPPEPAEQEVVPGPNGETIATSSSGGRLTLDLVTSEGTRRLLSVGAPSTYTVGQPAWSADGSYFVAKDDLDRLLLVTTRHPSTTRVLVNDAWGPAVTDQVISDRSAG
jgi:hypothetical protein